MYLDIDRYENSKSLALDWFERHGRDVTRTVSKFASLTGIPCMVVAMWIGQYTNWCEDSKRAVIRLQEFYGYTTIDGKPEGSPV